MNINIVMNVFRVKNLFTNIALSKLWKLFLSWTNNVLIKGTTHHLHENPM